MAETLFEDRPAPPWWLRWLPFTLVVISLVGHILAMVLGGQGWRPQSPAGWGLIALGVVGAIAWVVIELFDPDWLPGGRDAVVLRSDGLRVGEAHWAPEELSGEATVKDPGTLEVGLADGESVLVETQRTDELAAALRELRHPDLAPTAE